MRAKRPLWSRGQTKSSTRKGRTRYRGVRPFLIAAIIEDSEGDAKGRRAGMAQSQNTKVEFTAPATSFLGMGSYGNVMLGDRAFEFYNERNPEDYIQIPWNEIDYVAASVLFGGKKIARFAIFTKENGHYAFSVRDNKACLRAMRAHVPEDKLVRSLSFMDVAKKGALSLLHRD